MSRSRSIASASASRCSATSRGRRSRCVSKTTPARCRRASSSCRCRRGATVSDYALEVNGALRRERRRRERARPLCLRDHQAADDRPGGWSSASPATSTAPACSRSPPWAPKNCASATSNTCAARAQDENTLRYTLSLKFPQPVDEFTCDLKIRDENQLTIDAPDGVKFGEEHTGHHRARALNVRLDGDLQIGRQRAVGGAGIRGHRPRKRLPGSTPPAFFPVI